MCFFSPRCLNLLMSNWAASKTSIKGFSIRVHVGNLPRKQNLHARKPCESSAKGVRQGHAAKAAAKADDECKTSFTTNIFRESRRERYCEKNPTAKAKTVRAKAPRKPSRKLFYSRTRSLPGLRRRSIVFFFFGCPWFGGYPRTMWSQMFRQGNARGLDQRWVAPWRNTGGWTVRVRCFVQRGQKATFYLANLMDKPRRGSLQFSCSNMEVFL